MKLLAKSITPGIPVWVTRVSIDYLMINDEFVQVTMQLGSINTQSHLKRENLFNKSVP